jgi:hypothetical protein
MVFDIPFDQLCNEIHDGSKSQPELLYCSIAHADEAVLSGLLKVFWALSGTHQRSEESL